MSTVDERIVNMKMENSSLLNGVKSSQTALKSLNDSVDKAGKADGMNKLGSATDSVKQKFSLLNAAAVTAVATITNKVVNAGLHMAKSLAIDPILDGYREYTTNLKSIQTIMANTGAPIKTVSSYLQELNRYSDQTIYNFSDMARNIGTFTAAGVGLKDATSSIKGIANVAALSGSSAQQASNAMYQLSQAIAAGKVGAQDWNSVVNAGMAGHQLQAALVRTGIAMGELNKAQAKGLKTGEQLMVNNASFKTSIMSLPGQTSWLTSGVLVKGLAALDGRFSKAALSQQKLANGTLKYKNIEQVEAAIRQNRINMEKQGVKYTDAQFKAMEKMSDAAFHSAQTIKDAGQMIDVVKESIGSGWAQIFTNILGNSKQASKIWTTVGNNITNAISTMFYKINSTLATWRKKGGFDALWAGLANIFKVLGNLIHPFAVAFESLLPTTKNAGSTLANLSKGFEAATGWLVKLTSGTRNADGAFSSIGKVLKVVGAVIGGVVHYFLALVPLISPVVKGIFSLIGSVGQVVGKFLDWANLEGRITGFFNKIIESRQKVFGPILQAIGAIVAALGTLAKGDISGFKQQFKDALGLLAPLGDMISNAGAKIAAVFGGLQVKSGGVLGTIAGYLNRAGQAIQGFGDKVKGLFDSFRGGSADAATTTVGKFSDVAMKAGDGGSKVVDVFKAVASGIKTAAVAIGHWLGGAYDAISNWASGVDKFQIATLLSTAFNAVVIWKVYNLIKNLSAKLEGWTGLGEKVSGSFEQLTGTLKTMQNGVKSKIILNIAIAIGILAGSLWLLSTIPIKRLAYSLAALGVTFKMLMMAMASLKSMVESDAFSGGKLIAIAVAIGIVAFALNEMAVAVALFGHMDLKTIAKGLAGVWITLQVLTKAVGRMKGIEGRLISAAAAMVIMAFALRLMAAAILVYNKIDFGTFASGMVKMAAALWLVTTAMKALPQQGMLTGGAGMVLVAGAMVILAKALGMFAAMSVGEIAKSLITMSLALGILGTTLEVLQNELPGAFALVMVAGSLVILAKALQMLGSMSWDSILHGLVALAGALIIFLAAGAEAEVLAPGLLALGEAVLLVGAGMLAAGVGVAAFAAGLVVLAGLGSAAFGVVTVAIQAFLAMLPAIAIEFAAAVVVWLQTMAAAAPKIADAIVRIISAMLDAANRLMPKLRHTFDVFLDNILKSVRSNAPKFGATLSVLINTGLKVLINGIPRYVDAGLKIISGVLDGMNKNIPHIVNQVGDLIVNFIHALDAQQSRIINAGTDLIIHFIRGVSNAGVRITNAAMDAIIKFVRGLADAIRSHQDELNSAGRDLASAIASGMTGGLTDKVGEVAGKARDLASSAVSAIKGVFDSHSPSRVTHAIGQDVGQGLANGMRASGRVVARGATAMATLGVRHAKVAAIASVKSLHDIGLDLGKSLVDGLNQSLNGIKHAGQTMATYAVDTISKTATQQQFRADALAAKADALSFAAAQARRRAGAKGLSKAEKKQRQKEARAAARRAHQAHQAATQAQSKIDAAARAADWQARYDAADEQGKSDMLNERAKNKAAAAEQDRKKAIQLAAEADLIRAKDAKKAAALDKAAKKAMQDAEAAAKAAQSASANAAIHAGNAAMATAKDVQAQLDADNQAKKVEAMTPEEQAAYYESERKKQQDIADQKFKDAQTLLDKARAEAKSNAAQAAKDVAEAQKAVDAAEAAQQAADEAAQNAQQAADSIGNPSTPGSPAANPDLANALQMPDINIASNAVYGAQNMFDAYAKALAATNKAAKADAAPTITFEQNNYSPESLSPSEVYRQSKNLLSNAERKLTSVALPA